MRRFKYFLTMVSLFISVYSGITSADKPEIEWEKTFGRINYYETGLSVQQTTDNGYIIAGVAEFFVSGNYYFDVYLIKTDADGNDIWQKTFGESNDDDYGYSVQQTTDGGYIITGYTQSYSPHGLAAYLIKTDSDGNDIWQKKFSGSGLAVGRSVKQTTDGGYIITGGTNNGSEKTDVYLIKTDSGGDVIWQKTFDYGGTKNSNHGRSVQQTSDGGYIIAGTTWYGPLDEETESDIYLIKTDSDGNSIWQKTFGGNSDEFGYSVQQTTDGGYIIAGVGDIYLIKTDSDGNYIWSLGGGIGYSVQQTRDGGYIIASESDFDMYLIKTDSEGNDVWQMGLAGWAQQGDNLVQQTTDGGYIVTGDIHDVYLVKLSSECKYVVLGDLNDDCRVNLRDLRTFTEQWLETDGSANLDNFNGINFFDFALLAENWLIDCNLDPTNPACIPK